MKACSRSLHGFILPYTSTGGPILRGPLPPTWPCEVEGSGVATVGILRAGRGLLPTTGVGHVFVGGRNVSGGLRPAVWCNSRA